MVFEQITAMVISVLDLIFGPLKIFQPHISLAILSVVLTLLIVIIGRLITRKSIIAEIRTKLEDLRVKLAQAQKEGNKDTVKQLMGEFMKVNSQHMKHNFKIMMVSFVIFFVFLLPWASHTYEGQIVAALPFTVPFLGSSLSWIYWYALISFSVGWVIRKLFGFE